MRQPPHVGGLNRETMLQLVSNREVKHVGIGGFQLVIHSPIDLESIRWKLRRELPTGTRGENLSWRRRRIGRRVAVVHGRNGVEAGQPRSTIQILLSAEVAQARRHTKGSLLVESTEQCLAEVVVNHSKPGAYGGLGLGAPGDSQAGSKILLVPVVEACLAIGRTSQIERE